MLRNTVPFVAIFFIFICVGGTTNVAQFPSVNPPPPLPFSSLTLEIGAPSPNVLALEPVPITLKLTNNNSRDAVGYRALGFTKSPVQLIVRKPGSDSRQLLDMLDPVVKFVKYTHAVMPANESLDSKDLLTLGLTRYFPSFGDYEVQARLYSDNWVEFIESNVVKITVQEPTGVNRASYNLIRESSLEEYLFSGVEFPRAKDTLERLTFLNPSGPYARNARFILGQTYFHRKDYVKALFNLAPLENNRDFAYADKVQKYLAEIRRINTTQTVPTESEIIRP